jgi:hypothetical protein
VGAGLAESGALAVAVGIIRVAFDGFAALFDPDEPPEGVVAVGVDFSLRSFELLDLFDDLI